jgi:hypothetical protein
MRSTTAITSAGRSAMIAALLMLGDPQRELLEFLKKQFAVR